ncbi:PIN domain-containing protein [bacterium]|nr:PIN domain-containing protein [bacterium]
MYLVDTSVWIEFFQKPIRRKAFIDLEEVVTCLPVIQEVLQGFRDDSAFRIAGEAMFSFPIVESPLSQEVYEEAINLYRHLRRSGKTVRSSVDCLIAACALRHDLTVLHKDRDYDAISSISPLNVKSI